MAREQAANIDTSAPEVVPEPRYPGPGFRLGEYTISDTLGHGAMATVFAAVDATGHEVALKVFQEGPGVSRTMLERFRREAEASKKLRRHPHILTIYGTGKEGPYHYIVMESLRSSQTLETAMESTPMSLQATVHIAILIARALQYAHARNIVHRDVKPSNILIDEFGTPLLTDFGVAELVDWPSCTVAGALTGTPLYMSPEQARAERVGPASDIYSLGVVLYEAITGVLPYTTQHAAPIKDVLKAVKDELPKRPRLYRKEISPELEAVMFKALEKNPKDRYVDAEAFAGDLERAMSGRAVSAHHFTILDRGRHFVRQHERAITTLVLVSAVALGMGYYFRYRLQEAHYENLLGIAWRKNAQYALAQINNQGNGVTSQMPRAWQEIRVARRAMNARDWADARRRFRSATRLSTAVGDYRTAAIAQLDLARCAILLGERSEANQTYSSILRNSDAPPGLASLAQLEHLALLLLEGRHPEAQEAMQTRELPPESPMRKAMQCLTGELSARSLVSGIDQVPLRFRNDVYLAAAVRYYLDGDSSRALTYLERCSSASMPSYEWPGPFAKRLRQEFRI